MAILAICVIGVLYCIAYLSWKTKKYKETAIDRYGNLNAAKYSSEYAEYKKWKKYSNILAICAASSASFVFIVWVMAKIAL